MIKLEVIEACWKILEISQGNQSIFHIHSMILEFDSTLFSSHLKNGNEMRFTCKMNINFESKVTARFHFNDVREDEHLKFQRQSTSDWGLIDSDGSASLIIHSSGEQLDLSFYDSWLTRSLKAKFSATFLLENVFTISMSLNASAVVKLCFFIVPPHWTSSESENRASLINIFCWPSSCWVEYWIKFIWLMLAG